MEDKVVTEEVKDSVSIIETVNYLNDLLEIDPDAINALFSIRFACTKALADHKAVQVGVLSKDYFIVGMIGILNGLFGIDEHRWGHIAVDTEDGKITRFRLLDLEAVAGYIAKGKEEGDR